MNIKPQPTTARMTNTQWDPQAYQKFARLRERPVVELLDRLEMEHPERIYDLGCGTGIATQLLAKRWPHADLTGIDNSAEMLGEASYLPIKALWYRCDLQHWHAEQPADLLFAAAVLHFIDGHEELLPRLLRQLNPGGCLAAHMPNWRDALWYQLMLDTLEQAGPNGGPLGTPELRRLMAGRPVLSLDCYYRLLAPLTRDLDIWETEHLQVVEGQSPIFDWVKVSALRPVLLALNEQERQCFLEHYLARVRQYYPPEDDGRTLFPFKRIFILATV
ncbi:Trans-aconitate 2-methyltransferase [Pseudomonas chlororaphis]|uniref:Trans-aconitate 2-methyltransferase n=1 Tax=Pseudomonas chlororaphis TaxID=587753 RepID=A0A3G7TJD8_9PSED|nr:methyltransferase domain-containing protein [Pseudomonas chlororaphis]AZE47100.1 Trans-aconitate 2-methyltransferase [Pseudomonas chlororaphis]